MKIGCSSYSLRKEWPKESWTNENFNKLHDRFPNLYGWELISNDIESYWKKTEPNDLLNLKQILNSSDFEWFAITIPSGSLGRNSEPHWVDNATYEAGFRRDKEFIVDHAKEWIENAIVVGVKLMRIDLAPFIMDHKIPYSKALAFNLIRNIETFSQICALADDHDIQVGIENHGGFASDLNVLRKLFQNVPKLKLTYDVGNICDEWRFPLLEEFADKINFLHAKTHIFTDQGEEQFLDYSRVIGTLKDKGFEGWLSIEFEGPGDGITGVEKSIKLLQKYI